MSTVHKPSDSECYTTQSEPLRLNLYLFLFISSSRITHFLTDRHTGGGEAVSIRRRKRFTRQEDSWYSFPLDLH
jgi:hypothetical protein